MKNTLIILISVFSFQFLAAQYCGNSGSGICSPSGTVMTPGFLPTAENLTPLLNGQSSATVLQFKNYDATTYSGFLVTVQNLRFDSINNLPQGLCWSTDKSNNTYNNQEDGCISIVGTTCSPPGVYKLNILMTVTVAGLGQVPVNAADLGLNYFLRVKNAGDADVILDTLQTAAFAQPLGYSATANCNPQFGVSLGADKTVCGASVATLNPAVSNGVAPYTFLWSSTGDALTCTGCQNPTATITQNSTYTVTVIDANNNSVTDTVGYTVTGGTNTMQLNVTSTGIDCANPQDVSVVTVTGGTSPYSFSWGDASSTNNVASPQQHNYTNGNNYVISVTDNAGCVSTVLNAVAFNGIAISAVQTVRPNCINMNTGKLKVSASGGTAPYTFNWSNGAMTDSIVNVAAGNYVVTVTDVTSCSSMKYFNLSPLDNWGFYTYLTYTASNCGVSGSIMNNIYGGVPPYTYNWSGGLTTQNITYLNAGTYSVTVTDSLSCTVAASGHVVSDCHSIISGIIYSDTNNNCVSNAGESALSGLYVTASGNGQTYYGTTSANGQYSISVQSSGTYTLQAYDYNYYHTCGNTTLCGNPNQTITIGTLGDTSANNNFGFVGSSGFDLDLFVRWSSSNPGFQKDYRISAYNNSPTAFNGPATLTFTYDSNLIYQSSSQTVVHNLANHTLTWTIDSIDINYWGSFWGNEIVASFLVPVNLNLGYLLQSDFKVSPTTGDCDSSNNHFHTSDLVTGSYDPNEKKVEPAGAILEEDSILTYTIGFQNTGTDSTHFIIVKDTLSSNLIAASVRNIASSHPYSEFTISGNGILTWVFNPLRLVDSFTNEPGSHGFVKFTVKKKSNMPVGSIISNKAHIYFDYNTPVVTNTVADTVTEPNAIFEVRSNDGVSVKAFPNPFSKTTNIVVDGLKGSFNFELFDVTGRLRNSLSSIETNQFQLQRDNLSSGIYFFKIVSSDRKKSGYGKLVVE